MRRQALHYGRTVGLGVEQDRAPARTAVGSPYPTDFAPTMSDLAGKCAANVATQAVADVVPRRVSVEEKPLDLRRVVAFAADGMVGRGGRRGLAQWARHFQAQGSTWRADRDGPSGDVRRHAGQIRRNFE